MATGTTLTEEALKKAMDSLAEFQKQTSSFSMPPRPKVNGAPSFSPPWMGLDLGDPRGDFTSYTLTPIVPAVRFIESPHMVEAELAEDWTRVRSWSRAKRRRKQGHRQNIKFYHPPRKDMITMDGGKTYFVHPETMRVIREESRRMTKRLEFDMDTALLNSIYGTSF